MKKLRSQLDEAFRIKFDRVQVPIFELSKIFKDAELMVKSGHTPIIAMELISELYKVKQLERKLNESR